MNSINKNKLTDNKQVTHLNEISKRKVAEHNDLISSVAKMDKTPLKIFELAVSAIDTENPPRDNIVYLSKEELFSFFKVDDSNKHSRFKRSIEKMQKQAYFEVRAQTGKGYEFESIVPIPTVKWNSYDDEVMIRFNPDIMPYLIDLRQNFTQYALSDVVDLNSKYSIILYKWLSMSYNQFEYYSAKGGRRDDQVEKYRNPSISVKELRRLTDTVNEYQRFPHFENWVLQRPIKEINEHTHFNVTYEKVKKGRSIDSIVFHITKKRMADDNSYKQDDPAYLEEQEKKQENQQQLYVKAMQSRYTAMLSDKFMLSPADYRDIPTMAGLQKYVYPLYDELASLRGLQAVEDHISYVDNKKLGYTKRNIAKYLKKAIEDYLPRVKIENAGNLGDFWDE